METPAKSPRSAADKFSSLLDVSRRINSEKNLDALLQVIGNEAAQLIDAQQASIFLLDKAKNEFWTKLGVGGTIRFDARLGVAGAVLSNGKSMIVEDPSRSRVFCAATESIPGHITRNILCVPLRTFKSDVIGVFEVVNKRNGQFMPEDEPFLEALAAQAAIALETALVLSDLEARQQALIDENLTLRKEVEGRFSIKNILGTTPKIDEIRRLIERIAETSFPVLITGENGTGKELSARAIHYISPRRDKPFIALNCAALPEPLVESELFGIEKGVATGVERRVGRIESANGGTLFLDEIGDLSLVSQAKLLRVLQEREVDWVGGRRPVAVDIRVIAATNKDLKVEIDQGRFRADLAFRLNVIHVHLPPLREVRQDVPLLATHFLRKHSKEIGRDIQSFSPDALKMLTAYAWPGNVRELENEVRRAMVMSTGKVIQPEDLSETFRNESYAPEDPDPQTRQGGKTLKARVNHLETELIRDVMTECENDRRRAAKMLGLSYQGLLNKLKRYKIR